MNSTTARIRSLRAIIVLIALCRLAADVAAQQHAPDLPQGSEILIAASRGDLPKVIALLDAGTSVNACSAFGQSPMLNALKAGKLDIARELLRRGYDPTRTYKHASSGEIVEIGRGPLSVAIKCRATDVVDELLARGIRTFSSYTADEPLQVDPLRAAIETDQVEVLRKLFAHVEPAVLQERLRFHGESYLKACQSVAAIDLLVGQGVDVNDKDGQAPYWTALHVYAQRNWREGVEAALRLGADPTIEDRNRQLPEHVAASPEIRSVLMLAGIERHVAGGADSARFPIHLIQAALLQSEATAVAAVSSVAVADLQLRADRGWTILNYALKHKFVALAHALVDRGAGVRHVTTMGSSTVAFATGTDDLDLVRKLVSKGADVDAATHGTATALMLAVQERQSPMVQLLLSLGASTEPPRRSDREPWQNVLMLATKAGDIALMELILHAGGDLRAVDNSGEGLVYYAVYSGKVEVLQWVLTHGVDPFAKTPRGTNALTLAASLGNLPMIKALMQLGLTHPDALAYAQRSGNAEAAEFLRTWKQQANPDDPADFWTRGNITTDEVRAYVAAGRDVNYAKGCPTPLQQMAWLGKAEAVAFLLNHGADPARRGRAGDPAVFLALMCQDQKEDTALAVLRVFIEHGVSPNSRDFMMGIDPPEQEPSAHTLLNCAIWLGYVRCATYLLEKGADPALASGVTGDNAFDELAKSKMIDEQVRHELRKAMEAKSPGAGPAKEEPAPARPALPRA